MRIQDERDASESERRIGMMSPVAENFTYTFVRPAHASPLPQKVRVVVSYAGVSEQSTVIDLGDALHKSTGGPNEAIVFELRPGGAVIAYLDRVEP